MKGENAMTNDEIRKKNTLMELDDEIGWCKEVLSSDADDSAKESVKDRLEKAETMKKAIIS